MQSRFCATAALLATYPVVVLARVLPERLALRAGKAIGWIAWALLPGRRRVGERNLELAFPDISADERRRILRDSFRNLGRTIVEVVRLASLSDDEIRRRVRYAPGAFERLPADRGVIVFTGHLGNWELLALGHSLHGNPMRLVVRRLGNDFYNAAVRRLRERGGNVVVERGGNGYAVHELVEYLAGGGTVGLLVDQYAARGTGIAVPFFGKSAWTHRGPAMMAMRAHVPMAPAFLRRDRERPGCYVIHIGEPIEIDGTMRSARERLRLLTSRAQRALEEEIRRRPEEWLWIHRRWKRSSDGGDIYHLRHRRPPRRLKTEEIAGGMRRRTPLTGQR